MINRLFLVAFALCLTLAPCYGLKGMLHLRKISANARNLNSTRPKSLKRGQKDTAPKPNIIVITVGELGAGDLACYGHPTSSTPNIDTLAHEGMRFTQMRGASSIGTPSRVAVMTGRLAARMGLGGSDWRGSSLRASAAKGLPLEEITMAEELKGAGYSTKYVGLWHLGQRDQYLPTNQGFDRFWGIPYPQILADTAWNPDPELVALPLMGNRAAGGKVEILEQPANLNELGKKFSAQHEEFIRAQVAAKTPFLLHTSYFNTMMPVLASEEYCGRSRRGRYGDALLEIDDSIGRLMALLEELGIDDNTLVFFTGLGGAELMNGPFGGNPGIYYGGKLQITEGAFAVPGIARWPGMIQAGTVYQELVTNYDVFPTALAVAGVSPTNPIIDGKDLSQVLFSESPAHEDSPHDCIMYYKGTPGECDVEDANCPGLWAVRCGEYKLMWYSQIENNIVQEYDPPKLFNIDKDPAEKFSLLPDEIGQQKYADVIKRIIAARDEHLLTVPDDLPNLVAEFDDEFLICCKESTADPPECICNPENYIIHNEDLYRCAPTMWSRIDIGRKQTVDPDGGPTLFLGSGDGEETDSSSDDGEETDGSSDYGGSVDGEFDGSSADGEFGGSSADGEFDGSSD